MIPLGEAPFEMCWFYMGFAQIALDPTIKWANVEKSALKPSWQAFIPPPYGQFSIAHIENKRF